MAENEHNDFGNSEEFGSEQNGENNPNAPIQRVRIPRGNEVLGKVDQRVGANRMIVSCFDGKQRNCRVPGRMKRSLWIRPGNIILIQPWEFEGDKKGDIIFSYTPAAIQWLERKGFLKGVTDEF
jgi:translation initiation factor 1A